MFRAEAEVEDLKNPSKAHVILKEIEYLIEIHYDF